VLLFNIVGKLFALLRGGWRALPKASHDIAQLEEAHAQRRLLCTSVDVLCDVCVYMCTYKWKSSFSPWS